MLIPDAGAGVVYLYDLPTSPSLGKLTVMGYLRADPTKSQVLTCQGIVVDGGAFEVGTKASPRPLTARFDIVLTGARASAGITNRTNGGLQKPLANNWVRGIMSMNGGRVEMVRQARAFRTKLADHLAAASNTASVLDALNLPSGSRMLVAPTQWFGQSSPEVLTLSSDMSGAAMVFATGPATRRWGKLQYVSRTADTVNAQGLTVKNGQMSLTDTGYRPADSTVPYVLDQRATIACLDSTITVSCPNDADWAAGFGATMMFMDRTGTVRIDGVRVFQCGQQDVQGAYPIHWHNQCYTLATGVFLGDVVNDSYVRNCVVENSMNRGIVIHGTCGVTVQGNVIHNVRGQGIFLEDGVERHNFILDNVISATRRTTGGGIAGQGLKAFETRDSTGLWETNVDNTVTGNESFGHDGPGMWRSLPQTAPFGDNVLAFDDDAALPAAFVSATQFSVTGNFAGSFFVGQRVQVNNGGVRSAGVSSGAVFSGGITTVTLTGAAVAASMQAAAIPMNPCFIAPRLSENNVGHSNRSTGNRLDFAVLDEFGNVGQNVGAQAQVLGSFGGGNTPAAFSFIVWKNNGGGYQNRTRLALYAGGIAADNAGENFFGSQQQETGGKITFLLIRESLNTDGTTPYVQPQAGVAGYHGSIVATDCVFVGFGPISPDYSIQSNGALTGGSLTMWDEYLLPVHVYNAMGAVGNEYLSAHPGIILPSPEFDDVGPTLLDALVAFHYDMVQATTNQGSPTGFGFVSGARGSGQIGTIARGWTSAPADKTRMAKWAYGKRSIPIKRAEGDSWLQAYKPNFTGSDVVLGLDTVDYGGQGPTWSQMTYRVTIKTDGTVLVGSGGGADGPMSTPFQFSSAASNNAVRFFCAGADGLVLVQVSAAGGSFVTKHTFGASTTSDLHRYIGCDYSGVAGRDVVQSPAGIQHQYRKWKLMSAFLDNGQWGTPGSYLVNNIPYFTFNNTTTPVAVGSCPWHVVSPKTYTGCSITVADCADPEYGIVPLAVDIERIDPTDRSVKGTWHIYTGHEIAWTPFSHWAMEQNGNYVMRFPDNPPASRLVKSFYNVQWMPRNYRNGTTQGQIVWVEWPPGQTARVWCCPSGMLADGTAAAANLAAGIAKQAAPVADYASLQAATAFSCWLDTTNNLVGIKCIFDPKNMQGSANGAVPLDQTTVSVTV